MRPRTALHHGLNRHLDDAFLLYCCWHLVESSQSNANRFAGSFHVPSGSKWVDDPSDAVVPIVEAKIEIAFEQGITAQSEVGRSCVRGSGDVRSVPFSSDL